MCVYHLKNSEKRVILMVSIKKRTVILLKRKAMEDLIHWKSSPMRKPMIIRGARQVGKTWLMKEFGQNSYESYVYFNFD
mgnify:FL=1